MSVLDDVRGRVIDIDSHEFVPAIHWGREFGPAAGALAAMFDDVQETNQTVATWKERVEHDDAPIEPDTIWKLKGTRAPSATDLRRRTQVMDVMGIDTQLIFPTGPGFTGLLMATGSIERVARALDFGDGAGSSEMDVRAAGRQMVTAYNDWCIDVAKIDRRLRPVGIIDTSTVEGAIAEAQRVLDGGLRVVMIASDVPPGGRSPAHPDVDPFWRFCAEADLPIVLHLGTEWNFKNSPAWSEGVPSFSLGSSASIDEAQLNPYHFSQVHLAPQHFLTVMIAGGVFERHPALRFGVIELTAHWVGPMAENMMMFVDQFPRWRDQHLSMTPAEYLARNVRVTPFHWEPVDRYIDRFGLEDVYVFGSDYPHWESGPNDAIQVFADRLGRLGPSTVEKFFVTNGQLLTP